MAGRWQQAERAEGEKRRARTAPRLKEGGQAGEFERRQAFQEKGYVTFSFVTCEFQSNPLKLPKLWMLIR
jgi:hypothetical protein